MYVNSGNPILQLDNEIKWHVYRHSVFHNHRTDSNRRSLACSWAIISEDKRYECIVVVVISTGNILNEPTLCIFVFKKKYMIMGFYTISDVIIDRW